MKITVVTVCYNAEEDIRETIVSVLAQSSNNYEYIIKDGNSKDKTVELAEAYKSVFSEKNIHYSIISEPDDGIYSAMNLAAKKAQGDYVIYMNAGDRFCGEDVLEKIYDKMENHHDDIIYGDSYEYTERGELKLKRCMYLKQILRVMPFCHQAVFVRRSLLLEEPFDLSYKIGADYNSFLRFYLAKRRFYYCRFPICVYDTNGISAIRVVDTKQEIWRSQKENNVIRPWWYKALRKVKRVILSLGDTT